MKDYRQNSQLFIEQTIKLYELGTCLILIIQAHYFVCHISLQSDCFV